MNYRKWKFNKNRSTRFKNYNIRNCFNRFNYAPKKTFCIRSELHRGPSVIKMIQNELQNNDNINSLSPSLFGSASIGVKPSHDSTSFTFDTNNKPFEPVITSTPKKVEHMNAPKERNPSCNGVNNNGLSCKELLNDDWLRKLKGLNHATEKRSGNVENKSDIEFSLDNNIFDNFSTNTSLNKQLKDIENQLFESVQNNKNNNNNKSDLLSLLGIEMLNLNTSKDKDNCPELELGNPLAFDLLDKNQFKRDSLETTIQNFQETTKCSELEFNQKLDLFVEKNCWNFEKNNNLDLKFCSSFDFDLNNNNESHLKDMPDFNMEELAPNFKFENTLNFSILNKNKISVSNNHAELLYEPQNLNKPQPIDRNENLLSATANLDPISESDLSGTLEKVCKMKPIPVEDQVAEWLTQQVHTPTNEAYLQSQQNHCNRIGNSYRTNKRANFLSQQYTSIRYDSVSQRISYKDNKKNYGNLKNINTLYRKNPNVEYWNKSETSEQNINHNYNQNHRIIEPIYRSKQIRSKNTNDQLYFPKTYLNEPNIHIKNMNVY